MPYAPVAQSLNFALETVAFIDDQPAELAEMACYLPQVRCYPSRRAPLLPTLAEFTPEVVTDDTRRRREMYRSGLLREAARSGFAGPGEEFLRSLEIVMRLGRAGERHLPRVAELTQRTSQMNATGVHYSHETLAALAADPRHTLLVMTLTDRFGPHGATGIVLIQHHPAAWHVKLLATSCRVVSFGAGSALTRWLIDQAATAGVHLVADFRPTDRNRIMEVTYRFAGFNDARCDCQAAQAAPDDPAITRLHLIPSPQPPSPIRVLAEPALWPAPPQRVS